MTQLVSTGVDANGIEDLVGVDENGKLVMQRRCADVEPVIDVNKALLNDGDGYSPSRELRRVASIPIGVLEVWKMQYGVDPTARGNEVLLSRLLNDADNRFLRTAPGRVDFKERA